MITMTSLMVSITMVVLTPAAGQIGPRLIRTVIQDRMTRAVLGLFLADILHSSSTGRLVHPAGTRPSTPTPRRNRRSGLVRPRVLSDTGRMDLEQPPVTRPHGRSVRGPLTTASRGGPG